MRKTFVRAAGRALALLILGLPAARGAEEPARPAASAVAFQVDPAASHVFIKVGASGRIGHDHGVQGLLGGAITLGKGGTLVFDMRTFRTDSPEARQYVGLSGTVSGADQQKTNATMRGPQVLDVVQYPTAEYTITSAVPVDGRAPGEPGRYRLDGQLTLHGKSRPLPLVAQVDPTGSPGVLRMRCAFAIQQSDFGITPYSTLGGLVGVADRLDIWGDVVIRPSSD
jgi:polyisoprenoid-binding protein YceI